MDNYIHFHPDEIELPGPVRFSVSKKFMNEAYHAGKDPEEVLRQLSDITTFLIARQYHGRKQREQTAEHVAHYDVFTESYTYTFRDSDEHDSLFLVNYRMNDLRTQNNIMRNGRIFRASEGVIVQIRLTDPYNLFYDIRDGAFCEDNAYKELDCRPACMAVLEGLRSADDREEPDDEEEELYQPKEALTALLDKAEKYAILDSQREEAIAQQQGNIPYYSITPTEYDRIDRVCYDLGVRKIDENVIKQGVTVEICDMEGGKHSAEVLTLLKENEEQPATGVRLLFADHLDIDELPEVGTFNLTFNTVNKDVQLSAIEKIRSGIHPTEYMNTVFGEHASAGFDDLNLDDLMARLGQKTPPPTASQQYAIRQGINVRDIYLVMGPPGTGKTTVILEWVKYFVQQGKRVLISSQNNKAVDNVLERLAREKNINTIRIGSEAKLQANVVPYMFENKVKELREHIAGSVEENLAAMDRIERSWKEFQQCARMIAAHKEDFRSAQAQYDQVLDDLAADYKELQDLLVQYHALEEERAGYAAGVRKAAQVIARLEQYTGVLADVNRMTMGKARIHRLEAQTALHAATDRERSIVTRYNQIHARYQRQYTDAYEIDYEDYRASMRRILGDQEVACMAPPARDPGDIWGLFEAARSLWRGADTDFARMDKAIREGRKALHNLRDVMMNWQVEMIERQNYALNNIVLETVDLVGATCIGINSKRRFQNLQFDVTIIDESGQIQVHNALVPMSVAPKVIMLGDHKQIPPSADPDLVTLCEENNVETDLLRKSLFEQMYYDLPEANKTMLDTQFRMPEEIAQTISDWFYEGRYKSGSNKIGVKGMLPALSKRPYIIIDTSDSKGRNEHQIEGGGCDNALEARIIADIVGQLAQTSDANLAEIGVISAYKAQIRLIKKRLNQLGLLTPEQVNEMAATLDSFQGQERDLILYSFTKSSPKNPRKRRIGFLNELRRLNVAMSRCKKTLVMIGDMQFLAGCQHQDIDAETGEPVYEQSERQFSDFIQQMLRDVENGAGEHLSYHEFCRRMSIPTE